MTELSKYVKSRPNLDLEPTKILKIAQDLEKENLKYKNLMLELQPLLSISSPIITSTFGKWEENADGTWVRGKWEEDGSYYYFKVPTPLIPAFKALQELGYKLKDLK